MSDQKRDPRIIEVSAGDMSIKYLPPDFAEAYAVLAPIVAEAWTFAQCGKIDTAIATLDRAKTVIDQAGIVGAEITSAPEVVGILRDIANTNNRNLDEIAKCKGIS